MFDDPPDQAVRLADLAARRINADPPNVLAAKVIELEENLAQAYKVEGILRETIDQLNDIECSNQNCRDD